MYRGINKVWCLPGWTSRSMRSLFIVWWVSRFHSLVESQTAVPSRTCAPALCIFKYPTDDECIPFCKSFHCGQNSELRTQKFVYSTHSFYKQKTIYVCIKTYWTPSMDIIGLEGLSWTWGSFMDLKVVVWRDNILEWRDKKDTYFQT